MTGSIAQQCISTLAATATGAFLIIGLLSSESARAATTPEEDLLKASVDIDNVVAQTTALVGFGERIAGDAQELAAQQYVRDQLDALPFITTEMQTFPTTSWSHNGDTLRIVSAVSPPSPLPLELATTIYAYNHGVTGSWFGEDYQLGNNDTLTTLSGPIVDVGFGTEEEFGADGSLEGAIALVHRDDALGGWPHVYVLEAERAGAAALILYGYFGGAGVWTPPEEQVLPDGIKQDIIGYGDEMPVFSISTHSAEQIQSLLEGGEVVVELEGQSDIVSEELGESVNVAGFLTGTRRPSEYVVFAAHVDTWWEGALDDTTGVATVLELARAFSRGREAGTLTNERTIVFLSVGAEEFGGPKDTWYDWLAGSYEFVRAHSDVMDRAVLVLNMDVLNFEDFSNLHLSASWEIADFASATLADTGIYSTVEVTPIVPTPWTDEWSYSAIGGASNICCGVVDHGFISRYHTQLDDLTTLGDSPVPDFVQAYALLGLRADHQLAMPFDFTTLADNIALELNWHESLVPYQPDWFSGARNALDEMRAAAVILQADAAQLEVDYAAAEGDDERAAIELELDALNLKMFGARKILLRWTVGHGGSWGFDSTFLRTQQHAVDLAQVDEAIDALSQVPPDTNAALGALGYVNNMETATPFSAATYAKSMSDMINDNMYWGDDFDQQQKYVDVYSLYTGLRDTTMRISMVLAELRSIKETELLPWLEEDLNTLRDQWHLAAVVVPEPSAEVQGIAALIAVAAALVARRR